MVFVALVVVLGTGGVLTELRSANARSWFTNHPVTVALATGLILLVLTVFAVERWLALQESKRWRAPALAALDAYVNGGLRTVRRVDSKLGELLDEHRLREAASDNEPDLQRLFFDALMARDYHRFRSLAEVMTNEMTQLAILSLLAVQTVARHEPFARLVGTVAAEQALFGSLAQSVWDLQTTLGSAIAQRPRSAAPREPVPGANKVKHQTTEIEQGLISFLNELHIIRAEVERVRTTDDDPARVDPSRRSQYRAG